MNSQKTKKIESKMRDIQRLHESLENQCPNIQKKRLKSLMGFVQALLCNNALTQIFVKLQTITRFINHSLLIHSQQEG
jgi:hypothetical protein